MNKSLDDFQDHIHMLGCQAITTAWNLGLGAKSLEDDGYLLKMIEKHEKLLTQAVKQLIEQENNKARVDELVKIDPYIDYEFRILFENHLEELTNKEGSK